MTSIKELSDKGFFELSGFSETARLDSVLLLSHTLQLSKVKLILNSNEAVSPELEKHFLSLIERRRRFEPVAYITGEKEFYGLNFKVSPAVLIPRPETEILIDLTLKAASQIKGKIRLLDLGTGSGCIPVSLAKELSDNGMEFEFDAVDKNEDCLQIAKGNAELHGVGDKINFIKSNWFSSLGENTYDFILSNPPYIKNGDKEVSKETDYEPKDALYSGQTGLECIDLLISEVHKRLNKNGAFFCEIGSDQGGAISAKYDGLKIHRDLAGLDRVIEIRA